MKIVLLGKLPKGDEARQSFVDWKKEFVDAIEAALPNASLLNGDLIRDDVGSELVVGHDLWMVKNADVVVVDAREKIGAGTAQEMVMAKYFKKPIVAVIPPDTPHRRSNLAFDGTVVEDWVHPFLEVSSDYVADDIEDAVVYLKKFSQGEIESEVKDISVFDNTIAMFEEELPRVLKKYRAQGWG
ncbi:MAG: hypothetical protein WD850_01385 [Candidatus Spechtbacterales bacterium]